MITRSAWKKLNLNPPNETELNLIPPKLFPNCIQKVDSSPIPKPIKRNNNKPKILTVSNNCAIQKKRRKRSFRWDRKRRVKSSTIAKHCGSIKDTTTTTSCDSSVLNCENQNEEILKPILNYKLNSKPKNSRLCKTCCLDFVILPPIDLTVPNSKPPPTVKKLRGRPKFSKNLPKVDKKSRMINVIENQLKAINSTTPINSGLPDKSTPILELPPNMVQARIPQSKISRIPRAINIQTYSIKHQSQKAKQVLHGISDNAAMPEFVKETTTDKLVKISFPADQDLPPFNEINYNNADLVCDLEDPSIASSNHTSQPIENCMAEKLETAVELPPLKTQQYSETMDNRYLNKIDYEQNQLNSVKRTINQVTDHYRLSSPLEPLDLSVRTTLSQMDYDRSPFDHLKQVENGKIEDFLCDVDAIIREQDQYPTNSRSISVNSTHSKIFLELNKITRTMQLNEIEILSQPTNRTPTPTIAIEKPNSLLYNGSLNADTTTLNFRINQIFNFPCYQFLNGRCIDVSCKFTHTLVESRVLQTILKTEPIDVIEKCYNYIVKYDMLFDKYFDTFCNTFGTHQMIRSLTLMIWHCECDDRPIEFYRHIISGLGLCKLDNIACYAILVKNIGLMSSKTTDIMIELMLDLDVVLQFTDKLEMFLKLNSYRINTKLFDRLLGVGKCTKDPELIRILIESIKQYPRDCQRCLNVSILTQFLQMVRNLMK